MLPDHKIRRLSRFEKNLNSTFYILYIIQLDVIQILNIKKGLKIHIVVVEILFNIFKYSKSYLEWREVSSY